MDRTSDIMNTIRPPWGWPVLLVFLALIAYSCGTGDDGASTRGEPVMLMVEAMDVSVTPDSGPDGESAHKGKILRLIYPSSSGYTKPLLIVYCDRAGPEVRDIFGNRHGALDIFVTRSLDEGQTWSRPVNISNTAAFSSIQVDHDGLPETPEDWYFGDIEKPMAQANGKNALVVWLSKYAPGGMQRSAVYGDAGNIEVPYSALYAARSTDGGATWGAPEQLTDGARDAKQVAIHGSGSGFVITWQEDPLGLQPGEAEGPGDGGSGAKVSHGTDIWYTSITKSAFSSGKPFREPERVSNNFTHLDNEGYESGQLGASRPNLHLITNTVVIAYEETKGTHGVVIGKYIRYHAFDAFAGTATDQTAGEGWIISDPAENCRRARVFGQESPGPSSGIRVVFLWRQGEYDKGGPADIMVRTGLKRPGDPASTGLMPGDLEPPVDPLCTDPAFAANNAPARNLSSTRGLDAATGDDNMENARAHRGVLRGDFLMVGYIHTPDNAVAQYTNLANYNLYLRRSLDGGKTWDEPLNISKISDTTVNVREPRIIQTPSSPDPEDQRDDNTYFIAWSTEVNQYDYLSTGTIDLDVYLTHTSDKGQSYSMVQKLAEGPASQGESQMRTSPDGRTLYTMWMELGEDGRSNTMFRRCIKQP